MAKKPQAPLAVEALTHDDATRKNIPTAEFTDVFQTKDIATPTAKEAKR